MKAAAIGGRTITTVNKIVDFMLLTVIAILVIYAGYALWDSNQLNYTADKTHYAVFKPTIKDEGKSFKELQDINPEVFAWLNVYGTNIDYPVAQGQSNQKYINTNAEGEYSLSGAIFLDSDNDMDFSDFNNIIYGHHMEKKTMFGEIGTFSDKAVFDSHRYGNFYYDGVDHGIEFFAFVHADAYDGSVFSPNVASDRRQEYLDHLSSLMIYSRDIGISTNDQIVLLSTCSASSTNGRDILIGKLTDDVFNDPFMNEADDGKEHRKTSNSEDFAAIMREWPKYMIIVTISLMVACTLLIIYRRVRKDKKANAIRENTQAKALEDNM